MTVRMLEHTDLLYLVGVARIGLAVARMASSKRFGAGALRKF